MQEAEVKRYNNRINNLHVQSDKYMVALKYYKKVNCNAVGGYNESDLYPSFVGVRWEDYFGSSSVFSIVTSSSSGLTQYIVSTTFPTIDIANIVGSRRVKNIVVEQSTGSPVVKFTRTEELNADQYRNSFNKANILTSSPSSC